MPPVGGWQNPGRVLLNWSDDPIRDLEMVAEKYQALAHDRVVALRSRRGGVRMSDDFEAYPIVFLYRQAFELLLKAIVFAGAVAIREEGEEPMPLKSAMRHELTPLFKEVCRVFKAFGAGKDDPWDVGIHGLRTYRDFESVVREFDEIDSGSYTFRYSIQKDGATPSLDRGFEFDLFAFADIMDKILPALSGGPEWIRESLQDRWQAAYEAQQEAWANADFDPPEYDPPDYDPGDFDCDPPEYEPAEYYGD